MKKKLFYFLLLFSISIFSQDQQVIDSLEVIAKTSKSDSILMDTYNKLRRATYYSNTEVSQNYTHKYLEYAVKSKDSFNEAIANFYLGNSYVVQSDYETALDYYLKSANYFETRDSLRYSSVLNGIGAAYENSGNDSLSLNYFKKSQLISESRGDIRRSAIAHNNIGNIYNNRGDLINAKKHFEIAVNEIESTKMQQYILPLSINLATFYQDSKEFDLSSKLLQKLLPKVDTISDVYNHAAILRSLGTLNLETKKNRKALNYLAKAYEKYNTSDFFYERYDMMLDLISAYERNGKYKHGLKLFNEYNKIRDSIFTIEKDKNLTDALQKYEAEKKDAQLKVLTLESEKSEQQQRLYLILFISGLIIAGILGFFGYKNKKKNVTLAKQKKLLESTLDDKNMLLKEIHHRVKNSFQIVSSLLYLQSENVEDDEAKIAIKEAENRVRSMVLIHQRLYNKDEMVGVNTQNYFNDLVKDVLESHQYNEREITYNLDIEPLVLDIETVTPIGLILNELVVNTIKHAFKTKDKSHNIDVKFQKKNETLVLKVLDNGEGFEGEVKSTSFGIKLMKALSKKLDATLNYNSKPTIGTEATLEIKRFNILN